jgi:hypothetical protein
MYIQANIWLQMQHAARYELYGAELQQTHLQNTAYPILLIGRTNICKAILSINILANATLLISTKYLFSLV